MSTDLDNLAPAHDLADLSADVLQGDELATAEGGAITGEDDEAEQEAAEPNDDYSATYSAEDNKLRITAAQRLPKDLYDRARAYGYRWAPRQEIFVCPRWTPGAEDFALSLAGVIDNEESTLAERAAERAERFQDYRASREADSSAAHARASQISRRFEFGQPILVGHHSERKARKDQERMHDAMRATVKAAATADYWAHRAHAAVRHADYKQRPDVRYRRIKTLETDKRKYQRSLDDIKTSQMVWSAEGLTLEMALHVAGREHASRCFTLAEFPRNPPASQYEGEMSYWSALEGGVITLAQAVALRTAPVPRTIAYYERWIAHCAHRIAYERAMLGESVDGAPGGLPAFRFDLEKGGQVLARGKWLLVVRVNKDSEGRVCSVTTNGRYGRVRTLEEIQDYRAPSAEGKAAAAARTKLPPIVNYPGEGFEVMTAAQWAKATKISDSAEVRHAYRNGDHAAYRYRRVYRSGPNMGSFPQVYLSDKPTVQRPPSLMPWVNYPGEGFREMTLAEWRAEVRYTSNSLFKEVAACADHGAYSYRHAQNYGGVQVYLTDQPIVQRPAPAAAVPAAAAVPVVPVVAAAAPVAQPVAVAEPVKPRATAPGLPSGAELEAMRQRLKAGLQPIVAVPQLFVTPQPLAQRMARLALDYADIEGDGALMEPSAGTGALVRAMLAERPGMRLQLVEFNFGLSQTLQANFPAAAVHCGDFLACGDELGKFDVIVMNPPFANGIDIAHIEKARSMLTPRGALVALCADGSRQRERLQPQTEPGGLYEPLGAGQFADEGANVSVALLVIRGVAYA